VQAIYAPYCDTRVSFEAGAPGVDEMRRRIDKVLQRHPWLMCEDGGEALGYAYACPHRERSAYRWSVDVSVYVQPDRRRRGVGRALYTALLAALPLQGYIGAFAGVTLPNPASIGLHEAMGFQPVGVYERVGFKCGAWHDVAWFQRPLQPPPPVPPEPKPLADVIGMAAWQAALQAGQRVLGS
jgi:phosphinothricin acetyltransferase